MQTRVQWASHQTTHLTMQQMRQVDWCEQTDESVFFMMVQRILVRF